MSEDTLCSKCGITPAGLDGLCWSCTAKAVFEEKHELWEKMAQTGENGDLRPFPFTSSQEERVAALGEVWRSYFDLPFDEDGFIELYALAFANHSDEAARLRAALRKILESDYETAVSVAYAALAETEEQRP